MENNLTQDNIKKKRKVMKRRRRIQTFRLIFMCVILCLIVSAVLFTGFGVYKFGSKIYNEFNTMYQGYNDRRTARVGATESQFEGYTNILILGVDDGVEGEQHADTILLLSFSNDTGKSRLISIPRDTWVVANSSSGKIGNLYSWGGANLMVRHVSELLGISIHQFIVIDMSTFAELIDVLGGIDIYVEEDMDYHDPESGLSIHLNQGYQHLNGEDSQKYLRYVGSKLGDVGRVQRQQKFIKALYAKVLQLDTIPKLPAIADIFRNRMETSAEIFDSAHLANVLRRMSSEPPTTIMLPGNENDQGAWVPNIAEIDARMAEFFPVQNVVEEQQQSE